MLLLLLLVMAALYSAAVVLPQVDLSWTPERREDMLAGSDNLRVIPQLHVNGRVSYSCILVKPGSTLVAGRTHYGLSWHLTLSRGRCNSLRTLCKHPASAYDRMMKDSFKHVL